MHAYGIEKGNAMHCTALPYSLLTLLFSLCIAQVEMQNSSSTFQVGVILDTSSLVGRMGLTSLSLAISDFYSVNRNYSTRIGLHVQDSNGQVIDAAAAALSLLKDIEVDAIIGPQKSAQASFVVGLGDRANVPIISFSATSPSLQPQTPYFVQAALEDSAQVGAVASIIEYFKWSQVVIINEESDFGNGIVPSLSNAFQSVNARISHRSVIPILATDDYMLKELYKMKTMQTRVFVVHMSSALASRFFHKAKEAGMMTKGYAWIVTSGLMDLFYSLDSHVIESMEGVIGVKPLVQKSERLQSVSRQWKRKFRHDNPDFSQAELSLYGLWAYDAMWAVAKAAEIVQFREPSFLQNSSISNSTSPFITRVSKTGPKIRKTLSEITFEGLSGKFHLVNGKLEPSSFQILNVVGKSEREVGIWIPSRGILLEINGNISGSPDKKLRTVIFPGYSTDVPKGWELPVSGAKLKIGVPIEAGFPEFFKVEIDPETNTSKVSGCFIDIFDAVMAAMPYAVLYDIFPFENLNGPSSRAQSYDALSRQVSSQKYDGAVGDISITYKRSKYVDFTLPFTQGGISMIVQKSADGNPSDKWFFVKPFTEELWFSAIALFVLTGLALWILEHRFNGAFRGPPSQHAGMIFYFPFMSLVFAQREKVVNNFARLVVVVWMFVILILTSTYTASLSARLTVQGLQPVVFDANELIRKGDYVGCRSGSFIYDFLQEMGFDKSKIRTYQYPNDIDIALYTGSEKGGISAFFAVKLYTELFLSKYCPKYTMVGPTYPTEGYAFVLGKGSPLVADVSRAIIELTESGRLAEIEGQLRLNQNCIGRENTDGYSVPLRNFQALFAITGAITATCVIVFLATYLYRNRDMIARISSSDTTIWSKVKAIGKHFDQRDPKSYHYKHRAGVENISPSRSGNTCSSIVVPVSSPEINDAHEESNANSEQSVSADQTISIIHQEDVAQV